MLRLKKIEKKICQERSKVSTHRDSNIFFEHHISDSKRTIYLIKNIIGSIRFVFVKYLSLINLEAKYIQVAENPILLPTFDLKTKCIISEKTLINRLVGHN